MSYKYKLGTRRYKKIKHTIQSKIPIFFKELKKLSQEFHNSE